MFSVSLCLCDKLPSVLISSVFVQSIYGGNDFTQETGFQFST